MRETWEVGAVAGHGVEKPAAQDEVVTAGDGGVRRHRDPPGCISKLSEMCVWSWSSLGRGNEQSDATSEYRETPVQDTRPGECTDD